MLERSQPFALALLLAGLTALNTGCTSGRLLKSDGGFGWLGSKSSETNLQRDANAFPPPSSIEIPQSVNNQQVSGAASSVATSIPSPTATGSMLGSTAPATAALAQSTPYGQSAPVDTSMVQTGMYAAAAAPAAQASAQIATNTGVGNMYTSQTAIPAATPQAPAPLAAAPIPTAPATPSYNAHASATSPLPTTPVNQERSIYETEAPAASYNTAPAYGAPAYEAPANLPDPGYASEPAPAVIAVAEPIIAPTTPVQTPMAPAQPAATFYEARAKQPRAWRPGSTSDLKTL